MRRLLFILFLLLPLIIVAQAPIWRNSWSTNQAPPVIGTNLGVSNTASGFMWKFYAWPDSNMVARLGDVSNIVGSSSAAITNAVASVWTNGIAVVASGATNIEFSGTGWVASNAPVGQIGNVRVWNTAFGDYILKSNGFGTNLTIRNFLNVDTNLVVTNINGGVFGSVGIMTNQPKATLHIFSQAGRNALLIGSNTTTPTLTITNTFIGIGRPDPRLELDLRGKAAISDSFSISNGMYDEGGIICVGGLTNWGRAIFSNYVASTYQTAIAANTNAPTGIAVVQIAGGILGPGITATNQYVLLYTNPIYGKGFAVETNGAVTASSFTGITPGGGAFIADLNGNGTNTTLYSVGDTNIQYSWANGFVWTNNGYDTYMKWTPQFGNTEISGGLRALRGGIFGDLLFVTNRLTVIGPVYAQGFTNTLGAAVFTDVTPSKIAVFGPDRDLTNSTIDAADLAKIGTTNFPMVRITNMADVGLGLLLRTNALPAPADIGNDRGMSLAVSNKTVGGANPDISELWFLYSTNGTGLHVPMRQDFGRTFFDKAATMSDELLFNGGDIALSTNATAGWHIYPSNSVLNIMSPSGGAGLMGVQIKTNGGGQVASDYFVPLHGTAARIGFGSSGGLTIDNANTYPGLNLSESLGLNGNRWKDFYTSNTFSINVTASNGLTLPFASDLPSAASLSNGIVRILNTNGTVVVNTTTNGTNILTPFSMNASNGTINVIGPVLSTSTSSNSPVNNELVQAQWVRSLLSGSGVLYYGTTNITTATNIGGFPSFVYAYSTDIPYPGSRTYTGVTNSQYIGAIVTTNTFQAIQGPVVVNAYMGFNTGGGRSVTVHPEIYFSYDRTNWFGDYECANQALSGGSNLYQFVISFPSYTSTSSAGFYVERRFKIGTQNANPDVTFYLGTNTPSSISFAGPSSVSGNAYLGGNNTWTGSNIFTLPILGDGSLLTNVPFVISSNGTAYINATNLNFYGFTAFTNTSGRVDVGAPASTGGGGSGISVNNLGQTTNIMWDLGATNYHVFRAEALTNTASIILTNWLVPCSSTLILVGPTNAVSYTVNWILPSWGGTTNWYSDMPILVNSNKTLMVSLISSATNTYQITAVESR